MLMLVYIIQFVVYEEWWPMQRKNHSKPNLLLYHM